MKLKTAHIGRAGELFVQYHLLIRGVDSAPMSTDAGVDLVAYSPVRKDALSVQVKTNLKPKPGGGRGKEALDWWIPEDVPAELIALVDLSSQKIWLLKQSELDALAQQKSSGRYHLYMYTDPKVQPTKSRLSHAYEFQRYLLENRAHELFGV